ncbi:unnamed protein product [Acanthoscelides obtectus]|uniref:PiggyBac transposable element-derived protein domain-containing protein n=1 Tax=Acanthoscelides obtectus TaxID=200917 RepID=A0A9P0KNB2_ACAOB|nr:unnamed protein product [Acanthoscelides obtectus]CAK1675107.1 hypothetical protein AOBTE_LOCUS29909 [Acanthoscelides obtectus]
MLIELYRVPLKSRRWYLRIFGWLIDLAAVNGKWLVYRRESGKNKPCLKVFRTMIAEGLLALKKNPSSLENVPSKKKAVIPGPVEDFRYDEIGHFPIYANKESSKVLE